jgi:hypothetical protein
MDTQKPNEVPVIIAKCEGTSPIARAFKPVFSKSIIIPTDTTVIHNKTLSSRCATIKCNGKIALIGHCNHCTQNYCIKHRLPEVHDCSQQERMRLAAFEANAEVLMQGKVCENRGLFDRV